MRSDRRKAIEQQLEEKKNKRKDTIFNRFSRILAIIYVIAMAVFSFLLWKMNVVPIKYFVIGTALLALITIFTVPVMYSYNGKKGRKIFAMLIAIILIGVFGVGTYYLTGTMEFIDSITQVEKNTEDYYVLVKADSLYEDVSMLELTTVGTQLINEDNYSKAKVQLQQMANVTLDYEETLADLIDKLLDNQYESILVSRASFEGIKNHSETTEEEKLRLENDIRILDTIEIELNQEQLTNKVDVTKESFNIYISGIDIEGDIGIKSRSDVNMVVTVNPRTNKVLLTSLPRDTYVELPSKGAMDKLTHSGLYGIQESVGAVEKELGIDINYYVKVNYSTVVKLVDALGGIDIDSPYSFTTHGMQELNGITFAKGHNHLSGREALAYSRERKSWPDGDMRRNENQQIIIEAIIKKACSSKTILTKYTTILDAISGNVETSFTSDEISSIVKMQIDKMPSWDIEKDSVKGTPGWGNCYALGFSASIVNVDDAAAMVASDLIYKVCAGI